MTIKELITNPNRKKTDVDYDLLKKEIFGFNFNEEIDYNKEENKITAYELHGNYGYYESGYYQGYVAYFYENEPLCLAKSTYEHSEDEVTHWFSLELFDKTSELILDLLEEKEVEKPEIIDVNEEV